MRHVLVTGGAGYIGAHACKLLAKSGYVPVTLDNLTTGVAASVRFGPFVKADLRDRTALDAAFSRFKPVAVMHFAALSLVGEASREPGLYWRNNVLGSLTLIEAAVAAGCLDFIFSSTCATYGDHDGEVLAEDTPQNPANAYGSSKRAVEEILRDFGQSAGLKSVIFRYFNVAGADPEAEIGEWHRPETHLIPLMIEAGAGNRPALVIHGNDYPTHDGTCIRDYVHVMDIARAHVLGLDWLRAGRMPQGDNSRAFNLGTGVGFSVSEVIAQCRAGTGYQVPHRFGPRRPGDAASLVSGSRRAASELGWVQERSSLKLMIEDAWRWYQKAGFPK